jgi:transaldolase
MNYDDPKLIDLSRQLASEGFEPRFGQMEGEFRADPLWQQMRDLNTELWLDTGDIEAINRLWTRQFSALTTNNSLLNKEVQKGTYDELVAEVAKALADAGVDDDELMVREIAFILNAYHGLRLVERFDAYVSVELHTDLAHDVDATVAYGKRYAEICPERFTVKVPLTSAGLVAAGRLSRDGVRVNFTLGFSARENVLIALIARPAYCNVFLGRDNQVVKENDLGDGQYVGERALSASQTVIEQIRQRHGLEVRQIAASLRNGQQIRDLAGVDVLTMPPAAAQEFLETDQGSAPLSSGVKGPFEPQWKEDMYPANYAVDTLWNVPDGLIDQAANLGDQDLSALQGADIQMALIERGYGDILPRWTAQDVQQADNDGKIPDLRYWGPRLKAGEVGLDAVMTLSGLRAFAADQKAMDDRIRQHMRK